MSIPELAARCSSAHEPESLQVETANIAAFSLPQEALSFEPGADLIFSQLQNGVEERKIHCNTELRKAEQDQLSELWREAARQGDCFPLSVAVAATRYLSYTRGDHLGALEHMRETHAWRCSFFKDGPLSDTAMREDLRRGIVYFGGRDRALRPSLIIRPSRAPGSWFKERRSDKLLALLVFCMEYFTRYMVMPGKVENITVILDLKDMGVSQLPLGAFKQIFQVMSRHYIMRVFRFYVCNMPMLLGTLAGQVKRIMTDRQKQKLVFVREPEVLARDFAAHQLEEDLFGGRPIVKDCYPFPLPPGPFRADSRRARSDAVPNVHEAISAAGMRGRLWDAAASHADNTRLEYTDVAEDVLRRCDLPIPPNLPVQRKATVLWLQSSGKNESPKHRVSIGHRNSGDDLSKAQCRSSSDDLCAGGDTAAQPLPAIGPIDIPLTEDADDEAECFFSPRSSLSSEGASQDCTMLHPREDSAEQETEMGTSNEDGDSDTESLRDELELPVVELDRNAVEADHREDGAMSDGASAFGDSYNLLHESDAERLEEGRKRCGPHVCCHVLSAMFRRHADKRHISSCHVDSAGVEMHVHMLEDLEAAPEQLRMTLLEAQ